MEWFKNLSLRRKLVGSNMIIIGIVMIIGLAVIVNSQINLSRKSLLDETLTEASLLAEFSVTPILFDDKEAAVEILKKTEINDNILLAAIFGSDSLLFAGYVKKWADLELQEKEDGIGNRFHEGKLHVEYPIIYKDQNYGYLHLVVSTAPLDNQIRYFIILFIILLAFLLGITYLLATLFQRNITSPIKKLVGIAQNIIKSSDYDVYLEKESNDEIGLLYENLNLMIAAIRQRKDERVKVQQELSRASQILEATLNAIPDLIGIQGPDREIIRYNEAGYEFLGKTPEEVRGKKCFELIGRVKPCEICATEKVYRSRRPSQVIRYEESMDIWLDARAYPVLDDTGEVIMVIEHLRDITDIRNTQKALMESEREKNTILAHLNELIVYRNLNMETVWASKSAASHLGLSVKDMIGRVCFKDRHKRNQPCEKCDVQKVVRTGKPVLTENKSLDGRYWRVTINPVKDEDGKVIGTIEVSQDITEHKIFEKKLELEVAKRTNELGANARKLQKSQTALTYLMEDVNESWQKMESLNRDLENANRELEAFAYSVSHDLRAPLRHIDGFVSLLQEEIKDNLDKTAAHYLENIVLSSKNMSILIDELLTFSRMGRIDMKTKHINMKDIVQEALNSLHPETVNRKINWEIDVDIDVDCDPALMRQVWINLISNAVKFTRHKKKASIRIGFKVDSKNKPVFHIKDNGIGFDVKYVDKVFGVFQRLHNDEEFPGTGIGLANVKRIINRHHGKIWAEGKKNRGASFFFSLG